MLNKEFDGAKGCGDGAKLRVVSTKVSARMYARMKALLEGKGLSIYDFLSGCCSLVVSYLDNPHDISTEMAVAIQLFEGIDRFKHGFMLNGITPYTVSDAIYFIHAKGKTGGHGVLIGNGQAGVDDRVPGQAGGADCVPSQAGVDDRVPGQAMMLSGEHDSLFRFEDFNRQHILERAIEGTTPELYRRLRLLGVQMGTSSFLETLTRLVETELQDPVTHEVQKDFADDARVRTRTGTWVTMGEQARAITHRRRG